MIVMITPLQLPQRDTFWSHDHPDEGRETKTLFDSIKISA